MGDSRSTEPKKRVTPESFLRVLPTPFAATGPKGELVFKAAPEAVSERDKATVPQPFWRITLTSAADSSKSIALELHGDVTFGSSDVPDPALDINLKDMEGDQRSVSQHHIKLRPAKDKLFVMDLGSRNGTYANGTPITASSAYALQDGDLLTLGRLHLRVKIAQKPG